MTFLYFCLFKKLEFSTFYQISLIEMSQRRSDLLTNRNDNIKPNMFKINNSPWPLKELKKISHRLPCKTKTLKRIF